MEEIVLKRALNEIRTSLRKANMDQQQTHPSCPKPLQDALEKCETYFRNFYNTINSYLDKYTGESWRKSKQETYEFLLNSNEQFAEWFAPTAGNRQQVLQCDFTPYYTHKVKIALTNLNSGTKILPYLLASYYINSHQDMLNQLSKEVDLNCVVQKPNDIYQLFEKKEFDQPYYSSMSVFVKRFSLENSNIFSIKTYKQNSNKVFDMHICPSVHPYLCHKLMFKKELLNQEISLNSALWYRKILVMFVVIFYICCEACKNIKDLNIDYELSSKLFLEHTKSNEYILHLYSFFRALDAMPNKPQVRVDEQEGYKKVEDQTSEGIIFSYYIDKFIQSEEIRMLEEIQILKCADQYTYYQMVQYVALHYCAEENYKMENSKTNLNSDFYKTQYWYEWLTAWSKESVFQSDHMWEPKIPPYLFQWTKRQMGK